MAATIVSLLSVFEKTLKTNDFGSVMNRAMTMSRRPTPEDTLCELGRSEVVCLMAITSLGMQDFKMSITMSKAVLEFKLFPDITAYFAGKIRVEYKIPKSFLVRAYEFALEGNKLGFLSVPCELVSFLRVLINEAKEEDDAPATNLPSSDNTAGTSSGKGHKTQKQQAASRSAGGSSSQRSGKPPNPPIGRPCSPSDRTSSPPARPPTTPSPPSAKTTPPPTSAKPASTPVPQKPAQDPEDRRRATEELWKAVKGEDDRAVEAAVEAGADVRARGVHGWTPLHRAAGRGREAVVLSLISRGAELEAKGESGWTPLHCAAMSGREAAVLSLISHGAEVEAKSEEGWTPLHWAARYGHLPCTKLLVERGADPNARINIGHTPLALAREYIHFTVQEYLRSVGGTW